MATFSVTSVEILSQNTLLVTFSEPLSTDSANYLIDNYAVSGLGMRSVVAPLDDTSPVEVVLVTDKLVVGTEYVLTVTNLVAASTNTIDTAVTATFTAERTKLDKALSSTPTLYDTAPTSVVRQVLTAIHREDNKIGGFETDVQLAPATVPAPPFVWDGSYSSFPTTEAAMAEALGVDGSVSTDITTDPLFGSHIWECTALNSPDLGSLATEPFNFNTGTGHILTTHPNVGGGVRNVIGFNDKTDYAGPDAGSLQNIPDFAGQDGSKSFLLCMTLSVGDLSGGDATTSLANCWQADDGWILLMLDSTRRTGFQLWWGSIGNRQLVYMPEDRQPAQDEIFTLMVNVCMASGLIKLATPWGYTTVAVTDLGDYQSSSGVRFGFNGLSGWDGFPGTIAHVCAFQYDGTIDLGFSSDNMDAFLEYCST